MQEVMSSGGGYTASSHRATPVTEPTARSSGSTRFMHSSKKASLCASLTLQSIPQEMLISPHILEFLEQTLEPIPIDVLQVPKTEDDDGRETSKIIWAKPFVTKIS